MKEQLQKDFDNTIKNLSLSQKDIEIKKFSLDNFINKGFPNRKEEDWKFSDLNQIINKNIGELSFYNDYTSTNKVDTSVFVDGLVHNKIVFINGRIEKIDFDYEKKDQIEIIDQSEIINKFENSNSLSDLNSAFTNKSFKIVVKKGYQLFQNVDFSAFKVIRQSGRLGRQFREPGRRFVCLACLVDSWPRRQFCSDVLQA